MSRLRFSHLCDARAIACAAALFPVVPAAQAQVVLPEPPALPGLVLAEATAANPETVQLLTGLARVEGHLQLGLLFLQDGLAHPEGSHFARARTEYYAPIKNALVAAGIADFEPVLVALEAHNDAQSVIADHKAAMTALLKARSALNYTSKEMLLSIIEQVRIAAADFNPSGLTEVFAYQDAWSMMMVARTELDLLTRSQDPAIAKTAADMALEFDNVILTMPDPNSGGPAVFDPAPIMQMIGVLEGLAGTV